MAAVSCGIYAGQPVLDLDYPEDSEAGVDGNFHHDRFGQTDRSADERRRFNLLQRAQMDQLMDLAEKGVAELVAAQKAATA